MAAGGKREGAGRKSDPSKPVRIKVSTTNRLEELGYTANEALEVFIKQELNGVKSGKPKMRSINVKAESIPLDCEYLTANKVYKAKVIGSGINGMICHITDDNGHTLNILAGTKIPCAHLDDKSWVVI